MFRQVHSLFFLVILLHNIALTPISAPVEKLDDFKHFLQLHNKLPVTLLHLVSEPVFESIDGLPADLTDENVCSFKMASIHFGRFTWDGFYFDTDFLSFFATSTCLWFTSILVTIPMSTKFLLGTHMGVPCFCPASTVTPITIGSRELKIN